MRHLTIFTVALVVTIVCDSSRLIADAVSSDDRVVSYADRLMPRVRSSDSTIAALIARAYQLSPTFRRVVDRIDGTDGIVYVEPGRCRIARSCMLYSLTVAGGSRFLRIVVDPNRPDHCDVVASIGHELWHAWEVLREASVIDDGGVFFLFGRLGRQSLGPENPPTLFETREAEQIGFDVRTELRNHARATGYQCSRRLPVAAQSKSPRVISPALV